MLTLNCAHCMCCAVLCCRYGKAAVDWGFDAQLPRMENSGMAQSMVSGSGGGDVQWAGKGGRGQGGIG